MPVYEYECSHCGEVSDILLTVEEMESKNGCRCRKCDTGLLKRVMSTGGTFKLSQEGAVGWANNGYGDNTVGNSAEFKRTGQFTKR